MVVSEPDDVPQEFQIQASNGPAAPANLLALPSFVGAPDALVPLDAALQATVEVIAENGGGSACVISPEGWIITNCHVVQGGSGLMPERVSVGFCLNPRLPPDCQFWARVVATDRLRDLALLRIESGFYGQSLPTGYRFPSMALRPGGLPRIGEALSVLGYPTIGGLGDRATVTLTDGRVGGYQDRGYGVLLKSGAGISAGNSGGAALDAQGRLVGLPTAVAGDETSRMAYITPVDLIPADWLRQAGLGQAAQAR
jgi:S1-C subfamily serine protease